MDTIYLLIPLALVLLVVSVWAFFWAVKHDQFEDLDREANRILFDEDLARPKKPAPPTEPTDPPPG
ncbi:MAG TPA: cbb3-type cytochrome oxidase assembly protein CcoS [Dongiaceae bacterium]|nr:cbb3-type cytochrome oxidase assembly protein CcoS [Dongiaceae bacterium]